MSSLAWSANAKLEPLPARLRQLLLRLGQPEGHPHLAQHRDRRRQFGAGLVGAADVLQNLPPFGRSHGASAHRLLADVCLDVLGGDHVARERVE
jgi:hypothetical protein